MIQSKSTLWLQLSYGEYIEKHVTNKTHERDLDFDDFNHRCLHAEYPSDVYDEIEAEHNRQEDIGEVIEEIKIVPNDDDESENNDHIVQVIPTTSLRISSGVDREIHNLTTFYNTNPGETAEIAMLAQVFNPTELTYVSTIHDGNPDPKNYVEAKKSKD
jgi:hypothetical protein